MAKRAKKNSVKAETKPDPTLDLSEGLSDVPPTHEQVTIDFDAICVEQHGLTNSRKSLDQTEIDQLPLPSLLGGDRTARGSGRQARPI